MDAGLLQSIPDLSEIREGKLGALLYLGLSAFGFALLGFVVGYFIWRKGHMQTMDAEAEVHRSAVGLGSLREELLREEAGLGTISNRKL